jgi:hypothetical protein
MVSLEECKRWDDYSLTELRDYFKGKKVLVRRDLEKGYPDSEGWRNATIRR